MKEGNLRFEDLNIFYREMGSGPPIILLHCAGGASGQWRKFMDRMSDRFHLFAIDFPSHGRSDRMPADVDNEFDLEERLVAAIVDRAGQPAHLVGHSTGGSVAARVAIGSPDQVLSLSIYEPTLFQLLANGGDDEGWNDYLRLVTGMIDNFDSGNPEDAAAVMVDYWSKPNTFANLPSDQKNKITRGIAASVGKVKTTLNEPIRGIIDPTQIQTPTILVSGTDSPRSARGVIDILADGIKGAQVHRVEGAGHMGPLTHADAVNALFEQHIEQCRA